MSHKKTCYTGRTAASKHESAPMTLINRAGRRLQVVKQQHTQGVGRQHGTVQLELRDLATRAKQQERRRPGDLLEVVRLEGRPYQFLYREGMPALCSSCINRYKAGRQPAYVPAWCMCMPVCMRGSAVCPLEAIGTGKTRPVSLIAHS